MPQVTWRARLPAAFAAVVPAVPPPHRFYCSLAHANLLRNPWLSLEGQMAERSARGGDVPGRARPPWLAINWLWGEPALEGLAVGEGAAIPRSPPPLPPYSPQVRPLRAQTVAALCVVQALLFRERACPPASLLRPSRPPGRARPPCAPQVPWPPPPPAACPCWCSRSIWWSSCSCGACPPAPPAPPWTPARRCCWRCARVWESSPRKVRPDGMQAADPLPRPTCLQVQAAARFDCEGVLQACVVLDNGQQAVPASYDERECST